MVRRFTWVILVGLAAGSFGVAAQQTASVAGTATLTGTVESSTPYSAAQVFVRNTDKRMLYMVYTNAKRFRAVALFPGNYEISAATRAAAAIVVVRLTRAPMTSRRLVKTTSGINANGMPNERTT